MIAQDAWTCRFCGETGLAYGDRPPHHWETCPHWPRTDPALEVRQREALAASVSLLAGSLATYVHAHRSGNRVPPDIEAQAESALEIARALLMEVQQ